VTSQLNFSIFFTYIYIIFLVITCLVSLAVPIDKAMCYFYLIASILSCLTLFSLIGITVFLIQTGVKDSDNNLNIVTISGIVMLSLYLLPMILRPIDFLFNIKQYLLGLFSYIVMLPVFINIMQVYSMSNLHDISWGNRPTVSAGTDMHSINEKK